MRLVWYSNLDRRRSHQYFDFCACAGLVSRRLRACYLLFCFLVDQSRSHRQRHRVHPISSGNQRANSVGRRGSAPRLGLSRRRWLWPNVIGSIAFHNFLRFFEVPDSGVEWHGWLLGHRISEYSRLHPVRAQPTEADDWAGSGTSYNDDLVFADRNSGHVGHGDHLRRSSLGPSATVEPVSFSRRRNHFIVSNSAGHAEREYRRQHRFASERFFQSVAAENQLPHRRRDYLFYGHRADAIAEATSSGLGGEGIISSHPDHR